MVAAGFLFLPIYNGLVLLKPLWLVDGPSFNLLLEIPKNSAGDEGGDKG